MHITKTQQRLTDAKKTYDRLMEKHWATIKLLVRLSSQIRKSERDVNRYTKAVREERKNTKAAMTQAAQETREFDGSLGHLTQSS